MVLSIIRPQFSCAENATSDLGCHDFALCMKTILHAFCTIIKHKGDYTYCRPSGFLVKALSLQQQSSASIY